MADLKPTGRPIRALHALKATNDAQPLDEYGVWRQAHVGESDTSTFHAALGKLVDHGLAVRTGRPGGYEWYITEAGHNKLKELADD